MRSVEFIVEDLESLTSFLALAGVNLPQWEAESTTSIEDYQSGRVTFAEMEQNLYDINKKIMTSMVNLELWRRVGDDPDWIIFYQNMSKLSQRNSDIMDNRNFK